MGVTAVLSDLLARAWRKLKDLGGRKRHKTEEETVGEDAGGGEQAEAERHHEHIGARAFIEDAAQERWGREGRRGERWKKTGL